MDIDIDIDITEGSHIRLLDTTNKSLTPMMALPCDEYAHARSPITDGAATSQCILPTEGAARKSPRGSARERDASEVGSCKAEGHPREKGDAAKSFVYWALNGRSVGS